MELTGTIYDYVVALGAGVLTSFTPCVYPIIPVTAGIIASVNVKGSRMSGFVLSSVYVLGMAVTYCSLGIIAAVTGKIFGQIQNQPVVFLVVGNVILLFALVLFDIIPFPAANIFVANRVRPKNLWTVFVLGILAGFIVGPCTTPVLGTLLLSVAAKQNIFYAVSLLFVFSYGVGLSLILVGTFSGLVSYLPRSGTWLLGIKRFCGFILIGVAEYFLIRAGQLMIGF